MPEAPNVGPAPLSCDRLRWRCPLDAIPFETTADVPPTDRVVGQDSAVEALRFGLRTNAPGQHVFVRGLAGTGRLSLVRELLGKLRLDCPLSPDRVFVRNFASPDRPALITLPRGTSREFRKRVAALASFVEDELGQVIDGQVVRAEIAQLEEKLGEELRRLTEPFDATLREEQLAIVTIQDGQSMRPAIVPLVDGKPVAPSDFEELRKAGKLDDASSAKIAKQVREYSVRLEDLTRQIQALRAAHQSAAMDLRVQHADTALQSQIAPILESFEQEEVQRFLDGVLEHVRSTIRAGGAARTPIGELLGVNIVRGPKSGPECASVVENFPSLERLVGSIEVPPDAESIDAAHMWIRTGSMLDADGGHLILEAKEVLAQPNAWSALIRTLRSGSLELVPPTSGERGSPFLKPEAIPIHVKVVLVGDHGIFAALAQLDDDFAALFKVVADFDSTIPRDADGIGYYAAVLSKLARTEELRPFACAAVGQLVEHGARIAGEGGKLTARFGRLADIAREADLVAGDEGHELVEAADVVQAIRRTKRRADLSARKLRERVAKGTIRIQTRDRAVGQINGLAVIQAGPLTYGFPARITATVAPGTGGTINIEREAELSGAIHTKGFYILGGLLRHLLRAEHPITFDASIAFEQSYGGIDGDSASGAEICCLISALTELPIRQDLAMTGAIDQMGNLLPIGAVTEKIEGFYDTCVDAGLTGTQGVVIPQTNAGDLMLRSDVVEACQRDEFHVYAADRIEEALELFTGIAAGRRAEPGPYAADSVLGRASAAARRFWTLAGGKNGFAEA